MLLFSDFAVFRKLHWQHHVEYGGDNDPQGRDYLHMRDAGRAQLFWHLIRPLVGYNVFKIGTFKADMPAQKRDMRATFKKLFMLGLVHGPLVLLVTGFGQVLWLLPLYPLSAITVGLFLSQIRGFCEHIAAPDTPSEAFVRTHLPNWFDRIFFYTLNFNYHVEHHLYPNAPSVHLPQVHDFLKAEGVQSEKTISPSMFSTITKRFKQVKS